jgi:hypothetical protein
MTTTRKISELDYENSLKVISDGTCVFDVRNLDGFTKRQLSALVHRHAEKSFHGNFWSFQVANAAAARQTFGTIEITIAN